MLKRLARNFAASFTISPVDDQFETTAIKGWGVQIPDAHKIYRLRGVPRPGR